jgi:hypothetical protein
LTALSATWRSGYAAACKAVYTGSIPVVAFARLQALRDSCVRNVSLIYLRDARNYVLKEGALELLASYHVSYARPFQWEMRGIGPDGPDLWIRSPDSDEYVPADWRRLDGFVFRVPMRFAAIDGLPDPPERELQQVLAEALRKLRLILHEAGARFDAENANAEQAEAEARQFGRPWRDPAATVRAAGRDSER